MYTYDRRFAALHTRLFFAMSMEDAKAVLGFPPGSHPSPSEVNKAYKMKAVENHPDRGGSHEKMVEVNVAKEILEGKRREDRTPYKPTPKGPDPKEEAERARKQREEEDERGRQQILLGIDSEEKKCMDALSAALRSSEFGAGKLHVPAFLSHEYVGVLNQIHDEIETSPKSPDMMKAKALCHTLTGMATRLSGRAQKIVKDHGDAWASVLGMGDSLTFKDAVAMHVEMAKFIEGWNELYVESGKLSSLIVTSEAVPLTWDDLYHHNHQIIISFKDDFKHFSDGNLKRLESTLKAAVSHIEGMVFGMGYKVKTPWATWRMPGDFLKVADHVKSYKRP